jgi:CheY-like chemotaxis protein
VTFILPMIRLLIADDNAEFRHATELMVSREDDIEVVSLAGDGQEAVEQARQHQPDVAVIDVHMPRVDGLTAIRALSNVSPATICMAMSYDGEREILRQAMAAGAREYLIKPFNTDEFVNAVRRVAAQTVEPTKTGNLTNPSGLSATGALSKLGTGGLSKLGTGGLAKPGTGSLADPAGERQRQHELIQLAVAHLRSGRNDDEAARVFSELVRLPQMDANTLTRLAEIFLARRDWQTLRLICERLEKVPRPPAAR